jgi:hypothetical protein
MKKFTFIDLFAGIVNEYDGSITRSSEKFKENIAQNGGLIK